VTAVLIRPAVPDDALAIARVHVEAWRHSYRGMVADPDIAAVTVEDGTHGGPHDLPPDPRTRSLIFVADDQGEVVGFTSGAASRHTTQPFDAEVYALYVRPARQRQGVGQRLMRTLIDPLFSRGHRSLLVGVLEHNLAGRRFYEAMGGTLVGTNTLVLGHGTYAEVLYGWPALEECRA
jgi:hypothetical protein